jgi:hypothetical protein
VPTDPGAPAPVRTPVAPLAPSFEAWLTEFDGVNEAINRNDERLVRVQRTAADFATGDSITIEGGRISATRIDGGLIAVLHDVDGTIAGVVVYGDPRGAEVVSAVLTIVLPRAEGAEFDSVASAFDNASTSTGDTVIPAADGGQWVVSFNDGAASLAKLQDASAEWATSARLTILLDAIVVLPAPNG